MHTSQNKTYLHKIMYRLLLKPKATNNFFHNLESANVIHVDMKYLAPRF